MFLNKEYLQKKSSESAGSSIITNFGPFTFTSSGTTFTLGTGLTVTFTLLYSRSGTTFTNMGLTVSASPNLKTLYNELEAGGYYFYFQLTFGSGLMSFSLSNEAFNTSSSSYTVYPFGQNISISGSGTSASGVAYIYSE